MLSNFLNPLPFFAPILGQVFFTCVHNRALRAPYQSPTDLAPQDLPSPPLGLCNKSSKGKKIPLNTGHTGFRTRFLIRKMAYYTAPLGRTSRALAEKLILLVD